MGKLFFEIKRTRSSNEKYTFPMSIKLLSFYHFIQRELKWAGAALQIINFVKSLHSEHFNIKNSILTRFDGEKTTERANSAELKWVEKVLIWDNFYQLVIWKFNCLAVTWQKKSSHCCSFCKNPNEVDDYI